MTIPKIGKRECIDTGLALIFLCVLLAYFDPYLLDFMFPVIAGLAAITLFLPVLLTPLAWLWFAMSVGLGLVMPKVIFSALYLVFFLPFAAVVAIFRKDPLKLKQFKVSKNSVFVDRDHVFLASDLEQPF